jgi:RimJ/RimL family protein N-acetyltransferase
MQIPTPRLLLREIEEGDWRRFLEYQDRELYLRYNTWDHRSAEDVQSFIARFIEWREEIPRLKYQFAIELRSEQKVIGNCGIRGKSTDMIAAEIGFELDDEYWGQGYATEATQALLEFGFESLRLSTIYAHCVVENDGSARVLGRLGMQLTRKEPKALWMKNRYWDTLHFEVTRPRWAAQFRQTSAESR